ncbi:MAG: leucine-rich repeat protein [Eubacterium sp.]|nr:leucine-rich repeat protein [Eubacterium sp.]
MRTKKLISILLSVIMVLSSLTVTNFFAYADDLTTGSCGNNVSYSFDSATGTLTISGTGPMTNYTWSSHSPFYGNANIETVIINDGVTTIGRYSFEGCSGIVDVSISESVSKIGDDSFYKCRSLKSVVIPDGVTEVAFDSFQYCESLTTVIIPDSVKKILGYAFNGCSNLTDIDLPDSLEEIHQSAFDHTGLTSITIPDSVKTIRVGAFGSCKITSVRIPANVTELGENPFSSCKELESIEVDENNKVYDSRNNCNAIIETSTNKLVTGCKNSEIPNDVSTIGKKAFFYCIGLLSVSLPDSIKTIEDSAFEWCANLAVVSLSENLEVIGEKAFCFCKLSNVLCIPETVTSIGSEAFSYCSRITEIVIPNYYCEIYDSARTIPENAVIKSYCVDSSAEKYANKYSRTFESLGHKSLDLISVTNPTCTEQGYSTYNCSSCGQTFYDNYTETIPHSWDAGVVTTESTCSQEGVKTYTCTECSAMKTEAIPVDSSNHNYTAAVIDPSCTERGYTKHTCSLCGNTYNSDYTETIPHSWDAGVVTTESTCSQEGVKTYTCTECSATKTEAIPVDSNKHSYTSEVIAPSCTEQGYTIYTCSFCGNTYVDDYVDATGHDYLPTVTSATCLAGGYTTYTCSKCGDSYVDNETAAGDHSWNDGEILKAATYSETGSVKYTCSVCGETKTEDINYITGTCGEDVHYSFEIATGTLTLSGSGPMASYEYSKSPFYENHSIKHLVIEEGVTSVCLYAFTGCKKMESAVIPASLTRVSYCAFSWCTSLTSITVNEENPVYDSRNNCNAIIRTADNLLITGCKTTVIPDTVTAINECAFYGCNEMKHITIPNSVTRLGELSFYRCEALEKITIPNSVTRIDGGAFLGCKKINHFVIPDSVSSIGSDSFAAYTASDRDSEATRFDSNSYILPVARSVRYKNKLYMRFDKSFAEFNYNLYSEYLKFPELTDAVSYNIYKSLIKNGPKGYYVVGAKKSGNNWVNQYSGTIVDNTIFPWKENEPSGDGNQVTLRSSDGLLNDGDIANTSYGFIACIDLNDINSQTFSSAIYKTNKYVFYNNPMPFYAAKLIADANGGYLATATSSAENTVIKQIKGSEKDVILGAVKNSSLQFEWLNGETFNNYSNFRSGQPDHSSNYNGQWFLHMFPAGDWDDDSDKSSGNGKSNNGFIVEYAPNNIEIVYTETDATSVNENEITLKASYPDGTSANIETESINITKKNSISYIVTVNYKNEKGESFSLSRLVQINETGKCGDDAYYSYDGSTGTLTITGTGNIYDFSNAANAHFANFYADVKTVVIEEGITSIGSNTFNGCTAVSEISLPDTLTTIGSEAFSFCSSLRSLTIPENVTEAQQYAFYKCQSLKNIVLPKAITTIGKSAFLSCSALESITVYSYNTDIFDSQSTIPSQASIKSCPDSTAQSYAEKYNREFVAFSHEFEETNKDSTCSQAGGTVHTCILCGYSYLDNEQPLSEHSFVPSVIPATCTEAGYNVFTCSECSYEYREELPSVSHNWGEGEVTKENSCEEDGEKIYTCSYCKQSRTEVIKATGHNYSETSSTQATCTENGSIVYTCENCGSQYSQVIEATGHSYADSVIAPTCTEKGYTKHICSVCGNSYQSNYTPALGHNFETYVFNNDNTDLFDGSETAHCTRCNATDVRNIETTMVYSESIVASSGDEISVPVFIKNNTGLVGFGFEIEYDSKMLTPVSVTKGSIITSGLDDNLQGDAVPGKFKVVWYGTENLTDNGILMYLNFAVSDKASGETIIKLSYTQEDTFNEDFGDVELVCSDITITVSNVSQNTWYQGTLNPSSAEVTAGDIFYIALDSADANVALNNARHIISFDNSAFTFIGYADSNRHLVRTSAVDSTGEIVLETNNGRTFNVRTPGEMFDTLGIDYLLFKANDYASNGNYEFGYSITDTTGIDEVGSEGCNISIDASATSEIANIFIENGLTGEYADTVTVPVYISNNKGIMGYMINVNYNPEQLEIVMAQRGATFPGTFNDTIGADEEGTFSILWSGTDNIDADGVLANLTFRVLTDEDVISPINITYSQDDTFNSEYEDVVFNCISGSVHLNEEENHEFIDEIIAPTPNSKGYTKHTCINCGYSYTDNETDYASDMSALEATLDKATEYDAEDYSATSYAALQAVYARYLDYPNKSIPQTTIDEATSEILTAISNLVPYLFLTVKAENGTVSVNNYESANKYSLLFGDSVTMTATADEGYVFDGWYETVTKRIRSTDETFTFKITSNTDFEARFIKEESATLSFESEDGWIAGSINKIVSEWADITSIDEMLPKVPYKLGYTNGRWVYNENTVLQKLQNGENVVITPEYDSTDYENPVIPTPNGEEPALDLYYQLDEDNNVGSFVMPLGVPQDCHIESIEIALYYKKAEQFNPVGFELTINNKITTSKFEANDQSGVYTLDIRNFKDNYNWAVRGYVTYYDSEGNLKVAYSNQINIVARQQVFGNHIHSYDTVVTAPTCTDRGYTTYTCDECGYSYIDDHTEALGHSWNSGVITKGATCVSTGEKEFVCAVCGASRKESIPVYSANHKNVVTDAAVSPTCTESGLSEGSHCEDCKVVITEQQTVPATGHNYSAYVTQPTCTDRGYTTYTCETCGERNVSDYQDSLGHLWSEWAENGNVKSRSCSRCGITETEEIRENSVISIEVLSDEELSLYKSNSPEEYIFQLSDAISRANCSLLLTYNDGSTEVLHYDSMRDVIVGEADNEIYLNDIKLVGTSPLDISSVDVGEKLTLFGELYGCMFGAEFTIVEDPIDYIVITPELLYGGSRYLRSNEYVGNWYDFEQMFKDNNAVITVYYKDGRVEQNRVISREFEDSDGHVYYYNGFERSDIYFYDEDYSALSSGDTASGCVVVDNRHVFFEFIFE